VLDQMTNPLGRMPEHFSASRLERQVTTDALRIGYEESGPAKGTPIVLLHGFPDDVRAWDGVVATLTEHGYRTIVPYLRGFGPTRFLTADAPRSGQQAALGHDLLALLDALEIDRAILAGYDWGGRAACIVSALWPERVEGLVSIGGYSIQDIAKSGTPAAPESEQRGWYKWYFNTERGRAGLAHYRREFCRLLWKLWSPNMTSDDETFERTARSFENPDFVDIVVHSYRHRQGAARGDPALDAIEARLSTRPPVGVPTVLLHGGADGVDPAEGTKDHERFFLGPYERNVVPGAGHFLPREAPAEVVAAIRRLHDRKA
jgi:pimeloyl-ACP methyl ester carboxylesterase